MGTEAELDELQRKYRIMEGDRKSYAEEVANVVRKQKSQIDKLRRENSQLKAELELQSRAASFGESGIVSTRMTVLQVGGPDATRRPAIVARCDRRARRPPCRTARRPRACWPAAPLRHSPSAARRGASPARRIRLTR